MATDWFSKAMSVPVPDNIGSFASGYKFWQRLSEFIKTEDPQTLLPNQTGHRSFEVVCINLETHQVTVVSMVGCADQCVQLYLDIAGFDLESVH